MRDLMREGEKEMSEPITNGFTPGQQALVEKIAFAVSEKSVKPAILTHLHECPHGLRLERWYNRGWGFIVGLLFACVIAGASGGVAGTLLLKAIGVGG